MQSPHRVGLLRRVRRYASALGVSLTVHSIALLLVSSLQGLPRVSPSPPPERLFVTLGPPGPTAGGLPNAAGSTGPRVTPRAPQVTPTANGEKGAVLSPQASETMISNEALAPRRAPPKSPARRVGPTTAPTSVAATGGAWPAQGASIAGDGAGGNGSAGGGSGPAAVAYERTLAAWLNTHKYYPASLRRRGIEGEGKLRIRITRSGHVLTVDVASAFPHPSLEAISQDWVWRAEPFPPVPDAIPGESYVFVVPVGFRLQ